MSWKHVARLAGEGPYSDDRSERAQALFATYWGLEKQVPEWESILSTESRMAPCDYLAGRSLGWRHGMKVIGVVCEGFAIIDTSEGKPDMAVPKNQSVTISSFKYRRIIRGLEALDIPDHPV